MNKPKIVFFGTPQFSVKMLENMKKNGFTPNFIITAPDKPKGRKLKLTPSPVKEWAQKNSVPAEHDYTNLNSNNHDLFIVASFGKILPKKILEIPKNGTLNVHPSLLPKLRGPSPIQSTILLGEKQTGVTIMLMDEKMDEGPILTQQNLESPISKLTYQELENKLAELGGKLLIETIPKWLNSKIKPVAQNHNKATYTKLIKKTDGEIKPDDSPELILRKIQAFTPWPGVYTFVNGKRLIITKAEIKNDALILQRVKPEGKKEMTFTEFLKNNPAIIS